MGFLTVGIVKDVITKEAPIGHCNLITGVAPQVELIGVSSGSRAVSGGHDFTRAGAVDAKVADT